MQRVRPPAADRKGQQDRSGSPPRRSHRVAEATWGRRFGRHFAEEREHGLLGAQRFLPRPPPLPEGKQRDQGGRRGSHRNMTHVFAPLRTVGYATGGGVLDRSLELGTVSRTSAGAPTEESLATPGPWAARCRKDRSTTTSSSPELAASNCPQHLVPRRVGEVLAAHAREATVDTPRLAGGLPMPRGVHGRAGARIRTHLRTGIRDRERGR